jgi:hypothetical protein
MFRAQLRKPVDSDIFCALHEIYPKYGDSSSQVKTWTPCQTPLPSAKYQTPTPHEWFRNDLPQIFDRAASTIYRLRLQLSAFGIDVSSVLMSAVKRGLHWLGYSFLTWPTTAFILGCQTCDEPHILYGEGSGDLSEEVFCGSCNLNCII